MTSALPPKPRGRAARVLPDDEHRDAGRQQDQPGLGDARAEAVAGGRRRLQQLGQERERRVHARRRRAARRGCSSTPPAGASSACRSAATAARSSATIQPRDHDRGDQQPDHPRRTPAPAPAPGSARPAARPATPTAAPPAASRSGPGVRTGDSGTNSAAAIAAATVQDHRQPEQPGEAEVIDDRAGEDDAGAAADRGERGDRRRWRR